MKIRPGSHVGLAAVYQNGKVAKIQNEALRKLKYPVYQQKLNRNSICIVCNYVFRDKTRGWADNIKAICHPFHEECLDIFPSDKKLHLLSESDFIDKIWVPCKWGSNDDKRYDFTCFTIGTEQGIKCKGYHILPLIAKVANELGLRGQIIDYYPTTASGGGVPKNTEPGSLAHDLRKSMKRLRRNKIDIVKGIKSQKALSKVMKRSRFILFPNTRDASPRMIPEVLVRGTPIMVNKHIYGGWKYVNDVNGLFFDGPLNRKQMEDNKGFYHNEIKSVMQKMLSISFGPKRILKDYYSKYGFWKSAKRLAAVINDIEGKDLYRYVFYTDFIPLLEQWRKFEK